MGIYPEEGGEEKIYFKYSKIHQDSPLDPVHRKNNF